MDRLKILIPVDFTEQSSFAIDYISNFKEHFELEILLLHVVEISIFADVNKDGHFEDMMGINTEMLEIQQQSAKEKMLEFYESLGGSFKNLSTYIKLGPLTDTILSFAEKQKVDMILMGTKGAANLKAMLTGSETQIVARRSSIPVLTVMCSRPNAEIKDLLLISDFRDIETAPDPLILKFAQGFNARLHLLCIATNKMKDDSGGNMCTNYIENYALEHRLTNYEAHIRDKKKVLDGINHFDQMGEMDMIMLGTHGRKGIQTLIRSSIAENLINHLYKPILVYKI